MITAVDANVVLDILTGSPKEIENAQAAMRVAKKAGTVTISAVAYAEVAAQFTSKARADDFFLLLACKIEPIEDDAAFVAGHFFDEYKQRGGKRTRILSDFLVAAHAQLHADRILTRDTRFFGTNFPKLKAVSPSDLI
jgi:predicted nucleic acid-binding protein